MPNILRTDFHRFCNSFSILRRGRVILVTLGAKEGILVSQLWIVGMRGKPGQIMWLRLHL